MNHNLLRLSRKLLGLTIQESARSIAEVTLITWQRWEYGQTKIPRRVSNLMQQYTRQCRDRIVQLNLLEDNQVEQMLDRWAEDNPIGFDINQRIEGTALTIRLMIN